MRSSNGTPASRIFALEIELDRLVDGELADSDRRALLLRLDAHPDGWRQCALAFLSAQCWREAVTPKALATAPPTPRTNAKRDVSRWRRIARLSSVAAMLTLGFALGWLSRPTSKENVPEIANKGQDTPALPPTDKTQPPGSQLLATAEPKPDPASTSAALAPASQDWQHRGYLAVTQTRHSSLKLTDGREVQVPVHEVRLKYVRSRTY